jgi:2-dehydro-3-deoxyphosphogalactonate aldolase
VLAPNFDPAVVARSKALGLVSMPGVATPSEGFQALAAGADALKLFPGRDAGPAGAEGLARGVPAGTRMLPVGGVGEANLAAFKGRGAVGSGIGSSLYTPTTTPEVVERRARALVKRWAEST